MTYFFGYARTPLSVPQLREKCSPYIKVKPNEQDKYEEFWKLNKYMSGSYDSASDFNRLNESLSQREVGSQANRLFYLALPPSVFEIVTVHIKNECMGKK